MTKPKTRVTIVDADSIAYRCAAASEKRSIIAKHNITGREKEFSTITEFKAFLKDWVTNNPTKPVSFEDYSIQDVQTPEPIENCLYSVKANVERIKERTDADQIVILVGGKSTYRESLPLPSLYKGQRVGMQRPIHLKEAKQYLINFHKAEEISGIEVDDETIVRAYGFRDMGFDVTIASIDKDNLQVEDFRVYNYADDDLFMVEGHSVKEITKGKGKKVVGSGVGFLAYQMLVGDSTDCYNPTELAGIKYGDASALKDLKDCIEPMDFLEVVKRKYSEWYPEPITYTAWDGEEYTKDYKDILQMYFCCAKMLRHGADTNNAEEFFAGHGVEL